MFTDYPSLALLDLAIEEDSNANEVCPDQPRFTTWAQGLSVVPGFNAIAIARAWQLYSKMHGIKD